MSFTYGELKQAIQDYTENDETTFVKISLFLFAMQKSAYLKTSSYLNFVKTR